MSGAGVAAAKARIQREFAVVHADLTKAFSELELVEQVVDDELSQLQTTPESESVEWIADFEEDTSATLAAEMLRCEQNASPVSGGSGSGLYTFTIDEPIRESYAELIALAVREMGE